MGLTGRRRDVKIVSKRTVGPITRLGLALSGGGIRAAIFHLGVLQYLAEAGLFSRIASISSVSGASLCIGVIFAASGNKWPTEDEFLRDVQPAVRKIILNNNIQRAALLRLPFSPKYWRNRVKLLAAMLEKKWGIDGTLQDLPLFPFWEINCTTFETGGNFRFRRDYMGDSAVGYVQNPRLPISHMIAASAAFPVLIGPYVLQTDEMRFTRDKRGKLEEATALDHYTLWDGGVYDNLGLEALYKIGSGLDREIDFILVSNASAPISHLDRGRPSVNLRRLLDIATAQVDSLRTQELFHSVINPGAGLHLKIGQCAIDIADSYGVPHKEARAITDISLSKVDALRAQKYPTTLNSPSPENFELIFRHGYENARCSHQFWILK